MQPLLQSIPEKQTATVVYLYDGSFEGLLHAVAIAVKSKKRVQNIAEISRYRPTLFGTVIRLTTDSEQAGRLMGFLYRLHPDIADIFLNAYLSEGDDIGIHLYHLVSECVVMGRQVLQNYSHNSVRYLLRLNEKIYKEAHRYQGLLRFRRMRNDIFYAPFSPEYNVIGYLARHFRARLASEQWVLHDVPRDQALFWDGCGLNSIVMDPLFSQYVRQYGRPPEENVAAEEKGYQELWQAFHRSISNRERQNRQLQKKYIPERYWKYMVEQQR